VPFFAHEWDLQTLAAGVAETLSMEAPASPATPSPATPLSSQDAIPVQLSPRGARSSSTFTHKRAQAMSSSRARPPERVCSGSQWMVTFDRQTFQTIRKKVTGTAEKTCFERFESALSEL